MLENKCEKVPHLAVMTLALITSHAGEFDPAKAAFGFGACLGSAEVYAVGCATGVVAPKNRQTILNSSAPSKRAI